MPLTDFACRSARAAPKLKKLSDMGGLQLWLFPNGSKLWRLAYRFRGKQKLLAIGRYPDTSLLAARAERERAKALLKENRDPSHTQKIERLVAAAAGDTFEVVAKEYIERLQREGRSVATITKLEWLLDFARPTLGPLPVREIRPIEVLTVLQKVEARGRYDTARRLRSTIGAVCRYAVATARAEVDPTAPLQGALTMPTVKPRAAVTDAKGLGALLRAIEGFTGQPTTRAALKLMALLFPRPGELRAAAWAEFDLPGAVWTIPAARTKMRREHRVPLAPQAIEILQALHPISGDGTLLLPGVRTARQPMSEATLNAALRRLGYSKDEATAHGFRATASTLLNEAGLWSADAIERQLAHVDSPVKWPTRMDKLETLKAGLANFSGGRRSLPGVDDAAALETLAMQMVASLRRLDYTAAMKKRPIDQARTDPTSTLFDPERAAIWHAKNGNFDEAVWLIFLAIHFGKHPRHGWRRLRDVYSGLGAVVWNWERISQNVPAFREWLSANSTKIGGAFGNHRKYESLDGRSVNGTGAAVASYVEWVGPARSHAALFRTLVRDGGNDPETIFDHFYQQMKVHRFGRLGKFDFLAMLGQLQFAPITPGSAYLSGATGPLRGTRLLFNDNVAAVRELEQWLRDLDGELKVGMQVMEDSICNWQKSPRNFIHFKG